MSGSECVFCRSAAGLHLHIIGGEPLGGMA